MTEWIVGDQLLFSYITQEECPTKGEDAYDAATRMVFKSLG